MSWWRRRHRAGSEDAEHYDRASDRVRGVADMPDPVADEDPAAVRARLERMARGNPDHRDLRDTDAS